MFVTVGWKPYKTLANTYTSDDFRESLGVPAALIMSSRVGPVEMVNRRAAASASVSSVTEVPQEFYSTFTSGGNRALFNVAPLVSTTSPFFMFCRASGYAIDTRAIISLSGITGARYVEILNGGSSNPVVLTNGTARITGASNTLTTSLVFEFTGAEMRLYGSGALLGTSTAALTDLTRDVFGLGVNSTSGLSLNANHRLAGLVYGPMPPSFPREFTQSSYKAVFAPRRIWVPSSASGPPTLAAITASNLTASGARLTVTV